MTSVTSTRQSEARRLWMTFDSVNSSDCLTVYTSTYTLAFIGLDSPHHSVDRILGQQIKRTMGQGSSSLPTSLPQYALHCLRVAPSSPAHGHLEPFFDYLVGVDTNSESDVNAQLEEGLSPLDLGRVLESNEGKPIGLRVYNAKSQRIRGESYLCL